MKGRTWSQEVVELPGRRVIVISETLALAFSAGPDLQGYGLKMPRYVVVVADGGARAWGMDGAEQPLDRVRQTCPGLCLPENILPWKEAPPTGGASA